MIPMMESRETVLERILCDELPGHGEPMNHCMCRVLSHWYSFLLTASSPNPFITRSPGHIFEACQTTGSLTQSRTFSQMNAAADVAGRHKCILLQSAAPFGAIKRGNNSTSSVESSDSLSHLITELKLTNKKWDDNTTCHFFNFMHSCPASLWCIATIKSLCTVTKNDRFQWGTQHAHVYSTFQQRHPWPQSKQKLGMCLPLCPCACSGIKRFV